MQKTKFIGSLTVVLMVLMVWGALAVMATPGTEPLGFVTGENLCKLRVEADGVPVDVGNLNPGDFKESVLTVYNDGTNPLTYYLSIIRKGGKVGFLDNGKELDEILEFSVRRDGEIEPIESGLRPYFNSKEIGKLQPGQSEMIHIGADFPDTAGNEYQGSSVKVQFAFHAICKTGGGDHEGGSPGGPSGPGTGDKPEPPEGLEVDPPEEPGVPGEPGQPGEPGDPDEGLFVPQDDTPAGPGLPRTGQLPPWLWYGAGLALILAGLALRRRYQTGNR